MALPSVFFTPLATSRMHAATSVNFICKKPFALITVRKN